MYAKRMFDADPLKVISKHAHNSEVFRDLPLLGRPFSNETRVPYTVVFSATFMDNEFAISNIMNEVHHILFD